MRILSLSWRTGSPFGRIHWNFAGGWASTTFQHIREDHEDHGDDGEDHEDGGEDDDGDTHQVTKPSYCLKTCFLFFMNLRNI